MQHITELKNFIFTVRDKKLSRTNFANLYPTEYKAILALTDFLPIREYPISAHLYCVVHDITSHPICPICNTKLPWRRTWQLGFGTYCSTSCKNKDPNQQSKNRQGMFNAHGVSNPSQLESVQHKKRTNSLIKYGVDHPCATQQVKDKISNTNLNRRGVQYPQQSTEVNTKTKQTNLQRYGVEYVQQNANIKIKTKQAYHAKQGVEHHTQRDIRSSLQFLYDSDWLYAQHIVLGKNLTYIGQELGVDGTTVKRYLDTHGITPQTSQISSGEHELRAFLAESGIAFNTNVRDVIPPYELDIFIPSLNLAIEFNGTYWHSTQFKSPTYHANKTTLCATKGITLIHIFSDEWTNRPNVIKSMLKSKLGIQSDRIYARQTKVTHLSPTEKRKFLNDFHIQGNGSGSINYGLEYNNQLVACITFKQVSPSEFLLNRFATNIQVVGGFTKLVSHFQSNYTGNRIITFADRTISSGQLYHKAGFTLHSMLPPDYKYVVGGVRIHKFNFRHKQLATKLQNYDPNLSEIQNCLNNGIHRIYDCGKLKFIKNI